MSLARFEADAEPVQPARAAEERAAVAAEAVRDLALAEEPWRRLERIAVGSPFQRFDFFAAWHRHLGAGSAPLVILVRHRGTVAGVVPLVTRRAGPFSTAAFAGGSHANFNTGLFDPALLDEHAGEIAPAVRAAAASAGVDVLRLAFQPPEIAGRANPLVEGRSRPGALSCYATDLTDGFDAVLARHSGKRKRSRIRTAAKVFAEVGGYEVRPVADVEEGRRALATFLRQKAARLAAQGLPDVFAVPGTAAFFDDLVARHFAAGGDLFEAFILVHGEGVGATGFCMPFAGTQFLLMSSFEADRFARSTPGEVALFHMIDDAARRGIAAFDFGVGDARYKRSWCDRETRLMETVIPLSAAGAALALALGAGSRLRDMVRSNPALYRIAQRLRRGLRASDPGDDGDGD